MAMTGILVYFLCLLMAMNPAAGAQPTAGELLVRDVVVELNGETYDLGVDARLAFAREGEGGNLEFALLDGEEKLFPGRVSVSPEGILAQLDGMSRSFKLDLASAYADGDAGSADKLRELSESWLAWQEATKNLDTEALEDLEIPLDKGDPVATTAEYEGVTYDLESRSYTITMENAAAALEALTAQEPEFGKALDRVMNAALALEDEGLPEGGLPEYLRQSGIEMKLDVVEAVNEAEALEIDTIIGVVGTEESEGEFTLDLDAYAVTHGGRTHVGVDLAEGGENIWTMVMDTEETEEGLSTIMDMDMNMIQAAGRFTDLYEQEVQPVRAHVETFRGAPDENGVGDLRISYDYDLGDGDYLRMTFDGTDIQGGVLGLEGALAFGMRMEGTQLSVNLGVAYNVDGGITVEPALADCVDVLAGAGGEDSQVEKSAADLEALGQEATAIALRDSGKLMAKEGVAGLVGALSAVDFGQGAEETYYEDDEDGEMNEDDFAQVHSIAEAKEIFGDDLPLGDTLGGYSLESAVAMEDYLAAWYVDADGDEPKLNVNLNRSSENSYYFLSGDGTPERIEEPIYTIFGDGEDGYYFASWTEDGLSIDFSIYDSMSWEEFYAIISEINGAR